MTAPLLFSPSVVLLVHDAGQEVRRHLDSILELTGPLGPRARVFRTLLSGVPLTDRQFAVLVELTEPRRLPDTHCEHRYTYSDLVQRIIPQAVEHASCGGERLGIEHLVAACGAVPPTPESA